MRHAQLALSLLLTVPLGACANTRASPQPASFPNGVEPDPGTVWQDQDGRFNYVWHTASDAFVRDTPLHALQDCIFAQWRAAATAIHMANVHQAAAQGHNTQSMDVISIRAGMEPLTITQWNIVAQRAAMQLGEGSSESFLDAWAIADMLDQVRRSDEARLQKLRMDPIFTAAQSRLDDPDPKVVQHAGMLVGMSAQYKGANRGVTRLLRAATNAGDNAATLSAIQSINSYGLTNKGYDGIGDRVVGVMATLIERYPNDRPILVYALSAIAHAFDAPKLAATTAAAMLDSPKPIARQQGIRTLLTLCSYWDNPSADSRATARAVAMPALRRALHDSSTDVLLQAAHAGTTLGPEMAPLVPDLIPLLDHPDENTRTGAIVSLGEIGPAAAPALPRLREMASVNGNLRESIRDAIYMISQEGPKPAWYDERMKKRDKLLHADH